MNSRTPIRIEELNTPRDIRRAVLRLSWPVIAQNFLHTCMFFADTLMVGRYSVDSLAAVGIAMPVFFSITSVLMAISIGTVATVSRATGERDEKKVGENAGASLWFAVVLGTVVSVLGFVFAPQIVAVFAGENKLGAGVALEALGYFRIVFATFMCSVITFSATAILRGIGDTKTPMHVSLIANIANIFGNYVLIFGAFGLPALGLWGAAISTSLCRILEMSLISLALFSKHSFVKFRLRQLLRTSNEAVKRLVKVSVPAAVEPLVMHTGFLVYTYAVASLGASVLAAHRVAITIESISFMPGMGIAIACSAIVGQCLGAGSPEHARSGLRESTRLAVWGMTFIGLLFVLFSRELASLFFGRDMQAMACSRDCLLDLAAGAIALGAIQQPFLALTMVHVGALRGAGDTVSPVVVAAIGVWLVRVPLSIMLAKSHGLMGIWFTTGIDWAARALVAWALFRGGRWRRVRL
ncbi:MAG: MATE family efflux transporter [Planctomycetota bacterium]|nr:MATE family efflux transporter [Planctomycetota bacterium]